MALTPEQLMKKQEEMIETLVVELTRLNSTFDKLMEQTGFTEADLKNIDAGALTPELRAEFEKSVEAAKREGARRVTQAEVELGTGGPAAPGMGRQGAIRL